MKTWNFVDKSDWGDGAWQTEPDKVEWRDEATGYPCIARRGPMGNWCGYVAVPPEHPDHGKDYNDVDVRVHWGLTFASPCMEEDPEHGVCHVPLPGEPANVWWFGWDYGHCDDLSPGHRATMRRLMPQIEAELDAMFPGAMPDYYWPLETVKEEITSVAKQLKELET